MVKTKSAEKNTSRESLDLTIPYWFSSAAHDNDEDLQIGDYVRVLGLNSKFELMEIFRKFNSVRVRRIGASDEMVFPWDMVSPWKKEVINSRTVMRAIGNSIFRRNLVYRLSEPERALKQRKIHWDTETCDVQDEDGRVFYSVPWDDLEFVDDVDYNFPEDE